MSNVAHSIQRRRVLTGAGAALLLGALDGCTVPVSATRVARPVDRLQLSPLRADIDRITAITVCTRPFRPEDEYFVSDAGANAAERDSPTDGRPPFAKLEEELLGDFPQADIHYGLIYQNVSFVPRRDGLVFQAIGENDYYGFGDDTTVPDRAEAERAVKTIASLYA